MTLIEESLALRARYDEEPSHSDHVAMLALQIFDGLQSWTGLGDRPRELLHSAALLHDIGWSQTSDGKGHHKWSAKLIHAHSWDKLKKEEVRIVAQIARYHRKAVPKDDHDEFQELSSSAKKLVMILGGILRIADGLDRSHTGKITRLEATATPEEILVRVWPSGDWDAERAMFDNKNDMLQIIAKRPVRCIADEKS
jgi:exopolyphosphatase/guanosine-5'-triphosphate,3'-diphosphate pyrophosphatase